MEDKMTFTTSLFERVEEYGKVSYELFKLKLLGKTAELASVFISHICSVLVFSIFLIFLNLGVALWLGDILGKVYYGFLCVAGFYGIVFIVIHFLIQPQVKKRINNSVISKILN